MTKNIGMRLVAAVLLTAVLAGCASARGQAAAPAAQVAAETSSPVMTPDQTACTAGIDAFNAMARPLTGHDASGTVAAAQQWSAVLVGITGSPWVSGDVNGAIGTEAADISDAGAAAVEVQSGWPWAVVMVPAERQLDTGFAAVQQACQSAGVRT